jgi:hypothetical protein
MGEMNEMIADKVKSRCLREFSQKYPNEKKVIFIERSDKNIRILNKNNQNMLFDPKGREIITERYMEGTQSIREVDAILATFELL